MRYRYRPGGDRPLRPFSARILRPFSAPAGTDLLPSRRRLLWAAQAALILTAAVSLGLCASALVQSARTASLNRSLTALHASDDEFPALPAFPSASSRKAGGISLFEMSLPDGSPIVSAAGAEGSDPEFRPASGPILPSMAALTEQNPDTVGWLSIRNVLDLPVMYRNNTYYLTHDFTGAPNRSGALFLDENHPVTAGAQHLLIYGHNMSDGSMFGLLTHYRRLDSLKEHPLICFSTLWEEETYVVYAVVRASDDPKDAEYLDFCSHPFFADGEAFDRYIRLLQSRSMFDIPISVQSDDALLTLATCLDSGHLLVCARRVRPGESADTLTAIVRTAR